MIDAAESEARGQRVAILASPLHQLTGFYLSVDCRTTSCGGERAFAIADLASFYKGRTVGEVLRLMRCSRGCGGRVLAAWLETGPVLNQASDRDGYRCWGSKQGSSRRRLPSTMDVANRPAEGTALSAAVRSPTT